MQNREARLLPAGHELVGVIFATSRLIVVEVAPCEHVNPAHPMFDHVGSHVGHREPGFSCRCHGIDHGKSGAPTGTSNTAPGTLISL